MENIWSTYIQGAHMLYETRSLRFHNRLRQQYTDAFALNGLGTLLEIGAGPGALAQSLHQWYPHMDVWGIDRDAAFIAFAQAHVPGVHFQQADATALPFSDNAFDVTISNTVQEHIAPDAFFGQQYRVLRPGGICLILSTRRSIVIPAECIAYSSDFEKAMIAKTQPYYEAMDSRYGVGAYGLSEQSMPQVMMAHGFHDIQTHYVTVNLTPDNADVDDALALRILEAERIGRLESIDSFPDIAQHVLTDAEREAWKAEINGKYDERIRLYHDGVACWDMNMAVIMILRGVK